MLAAKARDLIQEMRIIPCGAPSLLPHPNSTEGGRPTAGEGSLSGTGSEQIQLPHSPAQSHSLSRMFRVPRARGPFSEILMAQVVNFWEEGEGARWFCFLFETLASFNLHNTA